MPVTSVTSGPPRSGLTASSGVTLDVLSGATIVSASIANGGSAIIEVGGTDSASTIAAGGSELVLGAVIGDFVAGSQTVSTGSSSFGTVTSETVVSGGVVDLSIKTTSANDTTISSGGQLLINGNISASNTTVHKGGIVNLESAKATLTGGFIFSGGGAIDVTGNTSAGQGDQAVISGFASGGDIDITTATTVGAAGTVAKLSATNSAGNTVATVSGGGAVQSFIFSGTAIAADLTLIGDGSGGVELIYASGGGNSSVGNGPPVSNLIVTSGETLTVYSGGTIVDATVLASGSAVISSGGVDSTTTVVSGGSQTVLGNATGDSIAGSQTVSGATATIGSETVRAGGNVVLSGGAAASAVTVESGGFLTLSSGTTASNTVISGGTVTLASPQATLSGSVTFGLGGTIDITAPSSAGFGDQAVISGFYTNDIIDLPSFGSGATLSTGSAGGDTTATVSSGGVTETLSFAGAIAANLTLTSNGSGGEEVTFKPTTVPTTTSYTPGDLVLSIYGDGANTGTYTLDQGAPIVLQEITTTGSIVSQLVLPQTTVTLNGTIEYAISGEYESASEGLLTLAANGQSLAIAGYGVTATAFDAANAATVYGTAALGQTTSLSNSSVTAVPRVIADVGYNATIDTSTQLYNVFNTNNPRSVVTVNGTSFYASGQGNGADGTEGVFYAEDGASGATPIYNTLTDTRDAEIDGTQLYFSVDSTLNNGGGLYDFGATLPTSATAPTQVPGIGAQVMLTAATANSVNAADIGTAVNLSPEQYFFADPDTLYIADGGDPKEGGLGDGGLQKWSFNGSTWVLDYTLSEGLNMVPDTQAHGTTGLIGLTGTVVGGNVILYATNETVAETDQTYLYGITDTLSATTLPTGESFTLLETAAPDTLIRGVAFAPTSSSTIPEVTSTLTVSNTVTSTGLTVASGGEIIVLAGGTISNTTILSSGSAAVSSGGVDELTTIAHGGNELVLGSASFDVVEGTQTVSNATAVVTSEVVENGGTLDLTLAGVIANGATVMPGGTLDMNGRVYASNTVISGGMVALQSPKATLSGSLTFVDNGGTLLATGISSAGYGDQALISGFAAGDVVDDRALASGSFTTTTANAVTTATITSGGTSQSFLFAGASYSSGLSLTSDGMGGEEIIYTPPPPIIVSSGVTSPSLTAPLSTIIEVLSGGTITGATILSGGSAIISAGGTDSGSTISSGGFETVSGTASGDSIYGTQFVTTGPSGGSLPATVSNETVFNGGTVELFLKPDIGTDITVSSGGSLLLNGNVSATDTVLERGAFMQLQTPKATLTGTLTFSGAAQLSFIATTSAGFGDFAVIDGFGAGDIIDEATLPQTATLTSTLSGGNTIETISGGTFPESFIFSGTTIGGNIKLANDAGTGVELTYVPCFRAGTRLATPDGEIAVEDLHVGDMLRLASGGARPVKWIGRRRILCVRHPEPRRVWPIRIAAGAFAEAQPGRDLYLSPDHAVFFGGVLIPAGELVNGSTVRQIGIDTVEYYHVELDLHDVILAEGLPTESFLDSGNRHAFDNSGGFVTLHPSFFPLCWENACADLVVHGPAVDAARALLRQRADTIVASDPITVMVGEGRPSMAS